MNTKKLRNLISLVALLATISLFSSCNRGVGCPSNFSMTDALSEVVSEIPAAAASAILNCE